MYKPLVVFLPILASLQVYALQLNPVTSGTNSTVIHPGDFITVSWTKESGDPARFDIDILWANGNLTTLAPNIDGSLTRTLVQLPAYLPAPDAYNIAIYQFGNPIVPKGPSFTVTPEGSTTTSQTSSAASSVTTGSTSSTTASNKKSNAGPIAGGVVGGVALLAIIAGLLFLLSRRKKKATSSPVSEVSPFSPAGAPSDVEAGNGTTADRETLMRQNQLLSERIGALERVLEDPSIINTPPAYSPETATTTTSGAVTKSRIQNVGTPSVTRTAAS